MSTASALDPAHTALLVMDYQPAILALLPESDSEALLGRMEKAIAERLAPQDGDIIVRKIRYGGLSTTDLDQRLRERGITTRRAGPGQGGHALPADHRLVDHQGHRPRLRLHPTPLSGGALAEADLAMVKICSSNL